MKPAIKFARRKDGVTIAYSIFGSGPGFVHVSPWVTDLGYYFEDEHISRFWQELANDFTIVIYDKHGCGQSDRDRTQFTLEGELQSLETVIEYAGLEKFTIFGMSCAGPISIAYTSKNPERVSRMILYATWANGNDIANPEVRDAVVEMIKASWGVGSRVIADLFVPRASAEIIEQLTKFQRVSCSPYMAGQLLQLGYSVDVSDLVPQIRMPTLILHREGDKTAPVGEARRLAAKMPNCSFNVFKGDIHLPWLGNPAEIIDAIKEFAGAEKAGATFCSTRDHKEDSPGVAEQATIVFTDIVSSTDFVNKLGDSPAREIFLHHDQIIRNLVNQYGGRELQNLGDGFMLSFSSASSAIRCVTAIQREVSRAFSDLKLRIGVNTGEVVKRDGDHPFGQAVVIAARILSECKGGQILVSDVTRRLVAGSKFSFSESVRFQPKGFDENIALFELAWEEAMRDT